MTAWKYSIIQTLNIALTTSSCPPAKGVRAEQSVYEEEPRRKFGKVAEAQLVETASA